MLERLATQRLWALFGAGWLLLNFPLLSLWDHPLTVWGLPLFPTALFAGWGVLIGLLAWVMESRPTAADAPGPDRHG